MFNELIIQAIPELVKFFDLLKMEQSENSNPVETHLSRSGSKNGRARAFRYTEYSFQGITALQHHLQA